jgi:myo-inositol 2-dehydrogenase / D-chiro-inositol 1-dehydrogenase
MPTRLCVIGAGRWSRRVHLPALSTLQQAGRVEVMGVCDLDAGRAADYAAELDAAPFADADQMIASTSPDALALLVNVGCMPDLIAKAIEHRIPFICEKPPAAGTETHRRLADSVGDLPHVMGYNRRHSAHIRQAKAWAAGLELQSVTALFSRKHRKDEDFSTTAVHGIDTALFLAGPLRSAQITIAPAGPVRSFFINGLTGSGVRVDILITPYTASKDETYIIRSADRTIVAQFPQGMMEGKEATVELHENNRVVERRTPGDLGLDPDDYSAMVGVRAEHEHFLDVLAGTAPSACTLADTLQTQQLRELLTARKLLAERDDLPQTFEWTAESR